MARSTAGEGRDDGQEIRLSESDGHWVAQDVETGVTTQGETREEALGHLDEAVALYRGELGESVDTPEEERDVLRELGIDPDEVDAARGEAEGLPDFME